VIIPLGYAQSNFRYTGVAAPSGAEWTMGWDVRTYGGDAQDLADLLRDSYNALDFDQFHTTEMTLSEVYVKYGPVSTGASAVAGTVSPGTAAAPTTPPQVTQIVRKHTDAGGRAGKGRLYFPGLPEAQISGGGLLSDTWKDNLPVVFQDLVDLVGLGNVFPVVLHSAGAPITAPSPITGFSSPARVGTQRRRNRSR
jgi:hypothetical protein